MATTEGELEKKEEVKEQKEANEIEEKEGNEHNEKEENENKEKEENELNEKEENSDSVEQNKVIFDGKNYRYTDANNVSYIWNAEKNNWEKSESVSGDSDKSKEQLYGFDGTYHTYTDPKDNTVYFWDKDKNAWFPKIDDDFLAQYQMNYGFVDNTTVKEEEKKKETEKPNPEANLKRKAPPQEPSWFELDDEHNTKVYVSNLPLDINEQEFVSLMQKCGLVMKDINTNKWKIKLYTEKESNALKGDALCTYIKRESVDLALSVLDGSEFRGNIIKVERAKFQMKGEYNPALKPKKKKRKEKEKEKKIQEKLFEWRPDKLRGEREKHERTVIIKNLFVPSTFDNHIELILEYTQDLREECSKCGTIKKLILHDKHPEGVAQVTFSDAEEADLCIKLLNNRWFGQRRISASTWDGKTKYKVVENDLEEKERLEKWNKFLEADTSNNSSKPE